MAFTSGTTWPMSPYALNGMAMVGPVMSFPITSAKPMSQGDIVIMTSGLALDGNGGATTGTGQAASTIIGIAAEAKASVATATLEDRLLVFPAYGGQLFSGNLVAASINDATPSDSTLIAPATLMNTIEVTGGYPCVLNAAGAAPRVKIMMFAREQARGANFVLGTTVNPRVIFKFDSTIFQVA